MRIASECDCVPNCLKYNPAVRREDRDDPEFPPLSADARPAGGGEASSLGETGPRSETGQKRLVDI